MAKSGREYGRARYVYVVWAVVETMLFGGLINGWASLVFVLKEDGLHGDLCTSQSAVNSTAVVGQAEDATCTAQDAMLNLWFTIATALRNIFGIVVGLHVFKFGTRSARLTGWVQFGMGSLMMAFANEEIPWLLLPSLMALSYGGVTLLLTNVQVSCLFPSAAGVVVTLVSGAFDFSATTQLFVKLLYESDLLSRLQSYVGLAGLQAVMVLFSTFCFMPKDIFVRQQVTLTEQTPPPLRSSLRKRRNSLYDWSEIKVHTGHHSLKCGVCDDGSSVGEQKEQLAKNEASLSAFEAAAFTNDTLKEDLQSNEKHAATNQRNSTKTHSSEHPSTEAETNGGPYHVRFTPARKLVPMSCQIYNSAGYLHDDVKPYFHSQGGLNGLNGSIPLPATSGALESTETRNVKAVNSQGKFISIIDIAHLENKAPTPQVSTVWNTNTDTAWRPGIVAHRPDQNQYLKAKPNGTHVEFQEFANGVNNNVEVKDAATLDVADLNETASSAASTVEEVEKERQADQEQLFPTLKSCLTCRVFWLHVLWQSFNVLRLVAFFGLINSKLTTMFDGDKEKVSYFTNVQAYLMASIMGICWISGAVYDWQTSLCTGRKSEFERRVLPGALPLTLTSLVGVAVSVLWMIDSEVVLYVMFAFLVFYNAFIFGVCISFLLRVFPERYFGILNGILSIIAGTFCFLQYGIFRWHDAYPQGPLHADIFMLILVVLSFVHPLNIALKGFCSTLPSRDSADASELR